MLVKPERHAWEKLGAVSGSWPPFQCRLLLHDARRLHVTPKIAADVILAVTANNFRMAGVINLSRPSGYIGSMQLKVRGLWGSVLGIV